MRHSTSVSLHTSRTL